MGGLLTQPVTTKQSNHGEGLGLRYGLSSMQGWRPEMEDAHDTQVGLGYGLKDWSFFAVFDGHAGHHTAGYASVHLLDHILKDGKFKLSASDDITNETKTKTTSTTATTESNHSIETENIQNDANQEKPNNPKSNDNNVSGSPATNITGLLNSKNKEEQIRDKDDDQEPRFDSFPVTKQLEMVKDAIKSGFLEIDQAMSADRKDMSGSTAICAFISPTHLFIANCGDSRAVLYDGVSPKFATEDHKPYNPEERKRIINAGGIATERVNGTLAVSRALGDFEFKKDECRGPCEQLVSPEPEVTVIERQPEDEFLILACDGIWDVMSNDQLCQFVRYNLMIESNLEKVCSSVLDVCLRKGSRDNMSIIIVVFEGGPKVDPKMIEQAEENDKALVELLRSTVSASPKPRFPSILFDLTNQVRELEFMEGKFLAPPGAGLQARYDLLRQVFDELEPHGQDSEADSD